METVRAISIGLSLTFLIWAGAIGFLSSRLVWANWSLFMNWRKQPRDTQVNMALWLGLPGIKAWMFWMRAVLLWTLITTPSVIYVTPFAIVQSIIVLPIVLSFLALVLWYVCDRAYGADRGDRVWWWLTLSGIGMGDMAAALFWGLS